MSMYQNMLVSRLTGKVWEHYDWGSGRSLDGIPVGNELANFGETLRKERAFRGVQFGAEKEVTSQRNSVYVYIPGHIYALGVIG
jgi:hypothetical protein